MKQFSLISGRWMKFLGGVCAVLLLCGMASNASALSGAAEYGAELPLKTHEAAIGEALGAALLPEALSMLPLEPAPGRQRALRTWLNQQGTRFVQTYTEGAQSAVEIDGKPGMRVQVEVQANRATLRGALREMGFFMPESTGYVLDVAGLTPGMMTRLAQLDQLYGLARKNVGGLTVTAQPGRNEWTVSMTRGGGPERAITAATLDAAWHQLWSEYFAAANASATATASSGTVLVASTAPAAVAAAGTAGSYASYQAARPAAGYTMLVVDGWRTAAAVQSFDAALRSWDNMQSESNLVEVLLGADSLRAYWHIRVTNRAALEQALARYLGSRNLQFNLNR